MIATAMPCYCWSIPPDRPATPARCRVSIAHCPLGTNRVKDDTMSDVIHRLEAVLAERKNESPERSYTARLLAAGEDEIVKKIGEEAIEVILAAKGQGDGRVVEESADLVYHLLVLLLARGQSWAAVEDELSRRMAPK